MNIYVETNFVLELAFEQEQCLSCEQILKFCEAKKARLILPAYSLAEPYEKLNRQARERRKLQQSLNKELGQLLRTTTYANRIKSIQDIASLMVQSNEEEWQRFVGYRERLLEIGTIIALTAEVLMEATSCEVTYDLEPQDAIIFASVISHLKQSKPQQACFLNRNSKDFDSPDIIEELNQFNCRMISRFDRGWHFIQSHS